MRVREGLARTAVTSVLGRIRGARLELSEDWSGERLAFGPRDAGLRASVAIRSPAVYPALLRHGSVGLGESYMRGDWDCDDLVSAMRIGAREIRRSDGLRRRLGRMLAPFRSLAGRGLLNTRAGARRNIAAHYDLGNPLFEHFLDSETMMYSAADYSDPAHTLEEAQVARLERICDRLELVGDDHLLEIGTGWGGLAVHAARTRGCRVTTTTISRAQREAAEARVRTAGLEGQVEVLGIDYRELRGHYDKLVSIEMIEAVGWQYFDRYFEACSDLLAPHGLFFLQAIVTEDGAYEAERTAATLANRLIFPGGCLPSPAVIQSCLERRTDLRTAWVEDISAGYVRTLREWRRRFEAATGKLEALGYDESFRRLWTLWLALCEAGFTERRIRDLQLLMAKPRAQKNGRPSLGRAAAYAGS